MSQPQGLILVTGPTGAGKSTTLYSMLTRRHSSEVNIVTIEDPIEYQVAGINQVQVDAKAGLTFASCLRAILRQDPDVIMVGEIRDLETAEIGFQAALTGHLVFSTLHTNGTLATIERLLDLGVKPLLVTVRHQPDRRAAACPAHLCQLPRALLPDAAGSASCTCGGQLRIRARRGCAALRADWVHGAGGHFRDS